MSTFTLIIYSILLLSIVVAKQPIKCEDKSTECNSIKDKCNDARHRWLMHLKCPLTCNLSCDEPKSNDKECKDVYKDCKKNKDNCNNEV